MVAKKILFLAIGICSSCLNLLPTCKVRPTRRAGICEKKVQLQLHCSHQLATSLRFALARMNSAFALKPTVGNIHSDAVGYLQPADEFAAANRGSAICSSAHLATAPI